MTLRQMESDGSKRHWGAIDTRRWYQPSPQWRSVPPSCNVPERTLRLTVTGAKIVVKKYVKRGVKKCVKKIVKKL